MSKYITTYTYIMSTCIEAGLCAPDESGEFLVATIWRTGAGEAGVAAAARRGPGQVHGEEIGRPLAVDAMRVDAWELLSQQLHERGFAISELISDWGCDQMLLSLTVTDAHQGSTPCP